VNIALYTEYNDYRIKTGSTNYWWLSSPYASDSLSFCGIDSSGSVGTGYAHGIVGVSPCFAKKIAGRPTIDIFSIVNIPGDIEEKGPLFPQNFFHISKNNIFI
jgi:hypothetical protein